MYSRFCSLRHLSRTASSVLASCGADYRSRGVTSLGIRTATGRNCEQRSRPRPPALLPVGHSPSRRCRQRRWCALTTPLSAFTCARRHAGEVCLLLQLSSLSQGERPHLLFRAATVYVGVGKFLSPLRVSGGTLAVQAIIIVSALAQSVKSRRLITFFSAKY